MVKINPVVVVEVIGKIATIGGAVASLWVNAKKGDAAAMKLFELAGKLNNIKNK